MAKLPDIQYGRFDRPDHGRDQARYPGHYAQLSEHRPATRHHRAGKASCFGMIVSELERYPLPAGSVRIALGYRRRRVHGKIAACEARPKISCDVPVATLLIDC